MNRSNNVPFESSNNDPLDSWNHTRRINSVSLHISGFCPRDHVWYSNVIPNQIYKSLISRGINHEIITSINPR